MAYTPPGQIKFGDGEEYALRPEGALFYNGGDPVEAKIVDWRAECFEKLGFTALAANALAARRDVDREQVSTMIQGGATPIQVADIVL